MLPRREFSRLSRRFLLLAVVLSTGKGAEVAVTDLLPLFAPPRVFSVTLSRDGRRIAYVNFDVPNPASVVVRALDVAGPKAEVYSVRPGVRYDQSPVDFLAWSPGNQLVFAFARPTGADAVYVVDADAPAARVLVQSGALVPDVEPQINPKALVRESAKVLKIDSPFGSKSASERFRSIRVIGFNAGDPGAVLVAAESRRSPRSPYPDETSTYRVDLATGAVRGVDDEATAGVHLYDDQGRARLLETPHEVDHRPIGARGIIEATMVTDRETFEGRRSKLAQETSPLLRPETTFEARQGYEIRRNNGRWEPLDKLGASAATLKFSVDAADFYRPRSFPLALGPGGTVLYYASNLGADSYGVYELDVSSGRQKPLVAGSLDVDLVAPDEAFNTRALVRDRRGRVVGVRVPGLRPATHWLDAKLATLQQQVDARFPGRSVAIEEWADDFSRVLLRVRSATEPGRYFVHEPGPPVRWIEVARQTPDLRRERLAETVPFGFTTSAGVRLLGGFTPALSPRANPPPLVVRCRDIPGPGIIDGGYDAEVQAIAANGYAVLEVFHRGTAGLGRAHRDAALADLDRIPVEDIRAAVAWARGRHAFDPRRVALLGRGFGGYVALRALEQHPDEFRCAVMINAPVDLTTWLLNPVPAGALRVRPEVGRRRGFFAGVKPRSLPVANAPAQRPVLIAQDQTAAIAEQDQVSRARDRFRHEGRDFMVLRANGAIPVAKAKFYLEIGQFLNASVFDYKVQVGKERVVE